MPETAAPRLHALAGDLDHVAARRAGAVPGDSLGVAGAGSERRAGAVPEDSRRGRAAAVPEDSLEVVAAGPERARGARVWAALWPKLAAVGLALALWELVVLSGWRPDYVLPGPAAVLGRLFADTMSGEVLVAAAITMKRALLGYAIALVVGVAIGLLMARVRVLRTAAGSLLTGLQTMPSVAWFPLAILLFQLSEAAILAVVVLGAAPSIANGLLHSFDQVPPLLVRAGRVLGARGLGLYRHIILPAALPGFLTGLKQGWAFAWRSLMAGELLVIIGHAPSIGVRLQFSRELSDAEGLLAWMIVVMILGVLVDGLVFGALERAVHRRRGLTGVHA
ncbi:ABC transporter permease [Nannocystis sp.]|uniref:ABC transporter permease n=1 Tax=Nannocystis sp. TaxID=1962667 RepID=UPI0025D9387A|nr:ABC transporter permease [Nannocystis sp.]MBK7830125.1 ABC transporter permease [Nannocystis sp.]